MRSVDSSDRANGDVDFVANAAVARWQTIVEALTPLLGQRGVAALYRRTLHVAGRSHPCLLDAQETIEPVTFIALRQVLMQQTADTAAAATDVSIETFHELLDSLIGKSLTQRLLGSVWSPLFSGSPAQEKSK
ncbi:hypothetical protein [Variovorax sp. HJSM1_2]|uniref:hypothetical protein n=1 Tax=Variovorax sp. HJSM1_2 TaxID=3366263 RepID=UPI003BD0526A